MFPLLFGFSHSAIADGISVIPEGIILPEEYDDDFIPFLMWFMQGD